MDEGASKNQHGKKVEKRGLSPFLSLRAKRGNLINKKGKTHIYIVQGFFQ